MKRAFLLLSVVFLTFSALTSTALAANTDIVIKEIQGLVQVQRQGEGGWVKPGENSTVTSGDKIRSFLESSALLVFPNGSEFRLRENTSMDVKDISQNAINKTAQRALKLNLGSLHYKVPPKKEKATEFKIYSSTSIVGITGTEGVVTAKGEGKTSENILLEGATYDTDIQGANGYYQKSGNVYKNDGVMGQLFSADVVEESGLRGTVDEEYLTLIKNAVTSFKAKRDEGGRVGQAEALIKQAFFYLEKREYDLVRNIIEQADSSLAQARKVSLPDNLDEKIADMATALEEKEAQGYDVQAPSALLGKAQSLKQSGEFGDIKQILTQAEKELALLLEGTPSDAAEAVFWTHYQNVEKRVLEKAQQGFSTGENRALLREAKIFYEQGEKPRAYLFLKEAEDKLALVLKNISDAFAEKVTRLQEEIAAKKAASYPTKELELRLDKVKTYIKEENFLKARESVAAIEEGLATLKKGISADWQLKISDLKKNVNYKRSTGYNLAEIPGLIGEIEHYQAQGDLANLESIYNKAVEGLAKLKLPDGFEASWKEFLKQAEKKKEQGYNLKTVNDLSSQIKTAIDAGDIKSGRTFLVQARKTLDGLKDQDPPKVQVISFMESEDAITVEGYAGDNIRVRDVTVNNFVVEPDGEGKFRFKTIPHPSLKKLSILATDVEGNISAPVVLPLTVKGQAIDSQAGLENVTAEYNENTLLVKGKFVPGGKVKVGSGETVCNAQGQFSVKVKPGRNKEVGSITVAGILSEDQTTEETVLPVEDKWMPRVEISKVSYDNNFVPALNIEPLTYNENALSVSGQVVLTQMANIEGRAFDLGGEIVSLKIEGTDVDIREDGLFNASLTIDRSRTDPAVKLVATDKSGNVTEVHAALDPTWNWPSLRINNTRTFQKSLGKFSKEILLTADTTDISIVLEDGNGETIVSKRLPVAAVLPPELEIQDIRYEGEKVLVSGRSTADGTVSEKNKTIFPETIDVTKGAVFTLSADYPPVDQEVVLAAANIEGKLSKEVKVTVGPPKDTKVPTVYLSAPQKDKKGMIIKGFVEDDSEVGRLTVGGMRTEISEEGAFSYKIGSIEGMDSVKVEAEDIFGNRAVRVVAFKDEEKPNITIDTWEARDGRLIISGKATDNIAVKQVLLNHMPIAVGEKKELAFFYNGALTGDSRDAVIVAVDLLNNETREGPRTITIPTDNVAPKGRSIGMKYGSPVVYASGAVVDPAGVKAVYVNGEQVPLYDDGTFNIKVSIDVGLPQLEMESPAYDQGKLIIAGKAAVGDFNPAKITVEAEDLSGNRGVLFSQDVAPYQLNELEVAVNGQVVEVAEDGSFRYEQPIALGQRSVQIKAEDPFNGAYFETQDLEDKKPVLSLEPLQYNAGDETILLSGKARDEGSGLYAVSVNGIRTDINSDGSFTYKTTFNQRSLNVVASDYIGNETALTKEIKPPDVWAPVFLLSASPVPAIVGDPVYVEIAALDSKTRLPEILKNAPVVKADADGTPVTLTVEGEGANYIATLRTAGLEASLVTVSVEGEDETGNKSSETEGTKAFALVADDTIPPSFTLETTPSPVALGAPAVVKVLSSEDLKEVPSLTAALPSGATNALALSEAGAGAYQASLTVPVEEGIGTLLLKLSGGEDLSGNVHDVTETPVELAAPLKVTELPLNINRIDFVTERFVLNGQTSSGAIVQVEAGRYVQDIVADAQGMFRFERPVSLTELEDMYTRGPTVRVRLKAHNYAGFESRQKYFEVPLPPLPTAGAGNFQIRLFPLPVGQGGELNISVSSAKPLSAPPKGFLYLPGGQRVAVALQGKDVFSAQYTIPEATSLGTGMFEVVSNEIRESVGFDVVLSDQWMQRLNKYDFFRLRVSQDPLIIGQRGEFTVETMGDLPEPPRLQIRLPNGRIDNIPLSGNKRFFQGAYTSPADVVPGQAELILNPGMPEEIRRPYGVENESAAGDFADVFLFANPNPLIGGEPYDVNVSFSQQIFFKPRLVLKLQNGRVIEMPLEGDSPSNKFMSRGVLPSDVETGLARFVLFDDRGTVIDRFPAQVSAPSSTSTGKDIFIVPGMLHRLETATIQLNSITAMYGRIEAHVSFPDGTKKVVLLEGTESLRKGVFTVPDYVPTGMVTVSVFDQYGMVGTINAQIVDSGETGGPVHIFLNNPDFQPHDFVRLNVEANWPLAAVPKAEVFWDGGSLKVALTGQVPGNRFTGEFMAPGAPITHGRIEVRDAQGTLLGDLPLDRGPEGEAEVVVTPMPPVLGQPLSIKVVAPSVVNSAPVMRLIFEDDTRTELNAYGPLPGDTFTASLAVLEKPLRVIEIVHEGQVVKSIPVDYLSAANFDFMVDILDPVIVPCDITDVIVRAGTYVPFTPHLSADFNGRIVDVPLSKISLTEFFGRMSVPCDVNFSNYNMRVFDSQGKLLWQRNFVSDTASTSLLQLHVMPTGPSSVELSWNMISGVDGYEIRYGQTAALGKTVSAGNVLNYVLPNLTAGKTYFFKVAARKSYQDVLVSDTVDTVVGETTLELALNYNVTDNDVDLYWAEYPGADKYRIQWGAAAGVYPNTQETTAPNYFIQDLARGTGYYVKIQALQGPTVIGESRDIYVYIDQFISSGGEIYFDPDPPVVGQNLDINMHFFEDLPFIPAVMVRLQNNDVSLTPTGQYRDYHTYLTSAAFDSPIMAVDVLDPDGRIIASRSPASGTYAGDMVPVEVIPDPPMIGTGLQVKVNFPDPVPFTPRLVIEFASGNKTYNFNQAPYLQSYEWAIPVADMNSSVLYMKVVDPTTGTLLAERDFGEWQGDGYEDAPFTVVPNPTIAGQSVSMTLDTDIAVSVAPQLRIYYEAGLSQTVNMTGSLPGQHFTYNIGSLNSRITTIDIIDPVTDTIKHTWLPNESTDPTSCEIIVPYDPPLVGQTLNVKAQFPGVVSYTPKARVYFTNNNVKYYTFPQGPGLSTYEIYIPAADITTNISHIQIWNGPETLMVGERFFTAAAVSVQALSVTPMPPAVNQSLDVHVEFNTYVGFTPRWRLHTINNMYEGSFGQGSGYRIYDQTIPASYLNAQATQLEIVDDIGNFIQNGEIGFDISQSFTCTAGFSPYPPQPYAALTVTANYPAGEVPSYIPWVFIEFEGGGEWSQAFPQTAGQENYSVTVPAANITNYVLKAGVGQESGNVIDCGTDFAVGELNVALTANPDPPQPGNGLIVTANFSEHMPFLPDLVIQFSGAPEQHFAAPGGVGQTTYQWTIPAADVHHLVDRIYIEDDLGQEIMGDLVFNNPSTFVIENISPLGSNQIDLCWTYYDWIDEYKIYYGMGSGNYDGDESPVVVGNSSCYTLGGYETLTSNATYYVKVEAYDAGTFMFGTPEEPVTLTTTNVEYPIGLWLSLTGVSGEIEAHWDSVSNVDGYKVYYGRNSHTYNESGSPLIIEDPSATQAVIGSLFNNVLYYITVEAYIGAVESNNPDEVSSYAGTGSGGGTLSASEDVLHVSGNAGASIPTQTVAITNNGTAATNVRFAANDLIFGANTISRTYFNITPLTANLGASGGSSDFHVGLDVPGGISDGLYAGSITFYSDSNPANGTKDEGEPFVNVNVSLTISSVDHFKITADSTSSTMGDPIFVTIRAEDAGNKVVLSYETDVTIEVSESSGGQLFHSWILSTNGQPGGSSNSTVEMFNGIGNFTVDAQEPETLMIELSGASGSPLSLKFTADPSESGADAFAIIGPDRASTGGSGTTVWVAAVDGSGKVVTGHTGTVNLSASGDGDDSPTLSETTHAFVLSDEGQFQLTVTDANPETVTVEAAQSGFTTGSINIAFAGVTQYLVDGLSGDQAFNTGAGETEIEFILQAADVDDNLVRSYNQAATFASGGSSYLTGGSSVTFHDGRATVNLNSGGEGSDTFTITEDASPAIHTGTITVDFTQDDTTAPTVIRSEMDTPWIVHLYFDEDLDSGQASIEGNYAISGVSVNKVCWYGDNVTLHLSAVPSSPFDVVMNNLQDQATPDKNTIPSDYTVTGIVVPDIDYTGGPAAGGDWFEIQVSDDSPSAGDTVHVTVYHKNVCGYLSGSNADNADSTVSNVNINYTGESHLDGSQPSTVSISDGRADFDVVAGSAGTVTISATGGSPTVDTTQVATLTIN